MSWQDTENYVHKIASYIWERPAVTENIAGVKCDCVVKIGADRWILIEITEQCSLEKVRSDILKLRAAFTNFKNLCMEGRQISNLYIENSVIDYLDITNASFCDNSAIVECEIQTLLWCKSSSGIFQ
jgi:hypothetical protein